MLKSKQQDPDSMLCAQHALNNLVQTGMFSAPDLASIAEQLDQEEASHMNPTEHGQKQVESNNYDDSGFFSLTGKFWSVCFARLVEFLFKCDLRI